MVEICARRVYSSRLGKGKGEGGDHVSFSKQEKKGGGIFVLANNASKSRDYTSGGRGERGTTPELRTEKSETAGKLSGRTRHVRKVRRRTNFRFPKGPEGRKGSVDRNFPSFFSASRKR